MTIQINPNRVRVASGNTTTTGQRRNSEDSESKQVIPARADVGVIPAPESLGTLIRSAVSALRQGVYWDRGTILNILV